MGPTKLHFLHDSLKWFPDYNKLRSIKNSISSWSSSRQKNRHHEVMLTRLRIGHTRLTHEHLMKSPHGNPPICAECQCQISIKHIFIECKKYEHYRQIFKKNNLKDILGESENFSFYSILTFLKQTNLITRI